MTRRKWGFRSVEQLEDHFLWHGDELGIATVDEYGKEAFELFNRMLDENWQECEQSLGRVRYHFVTQQVLYLSKRLYRKQERAVETAATKAQNLPSQVQNSANS